MGRFDRRCAIVTGAASGIGRATVARLSADGCAVAAVDRDAAGLADTVGGCGPESSVVPVLVDLLDEAAIGRAVAGAVSHLRGLDILVNVAGIAVAGSVEQLSAQDWDRCQAVNVRGSWLMMRECLPHLLGAATPCIVNTSSLQAIRGMPGWAAYAASKGALVSLTRQAAVEYAPHGLRVNAVLPGTIRTGMNEGILAASDDPAGVMRDWGSLHALGRFGEASEVAAAIAFLASADASFVTGHCLPVDGGASVLGVRRDTAAEPGDDP